ncbi:MAG: hydrogenase maturation protease [gamma proteobacterium symbiont of Taylorina sp.]|nr:hydrogenase maturation protease [gamma proteobacterium symbiont of Taylorina sp.]
MVLILGVGNSLLQDDGIGCHLLKRLHLEKPHWPVEFLDGGTLSFGITTAIESCSHLIIIDAANLHKPPGSIELFFDTKLDEFLNKPGKSVHEVSLSDLFDMTRLTDSIPAHRLMVAIQPQNITWGENLTEAVYLAQSEAIKQIEVVLTNWGIIEQQKVAIRTAEYEY